MNSLPYNQCQILVVDRKRLQDALGVMGGSLDSKTRWVSLAYRDCQLNIVAGTDNATIEAKGHWLETIFIDASWIRKMQSLLPPGEPVVLRAEGSHFHTNHFSQPYRLDIPTTIDDPTTMPPKMRSLRIEKAAKLLSDFRVTLRDLESMVDSIQSRGDSIWRRDERQMINVVAKVWALLAPLGVETSDLRILIDDAVRDAFTKS